MRSLRLIGAAAVLAALASLALPVAPSVAPFLANPLAAPACAGAGPHHAALVVTHGDGSTVTRCVAFATASISGEQLLNASGISWSGQSFAGFGQAVCAVDREPATYATCPGKDRYWAVFVARSGGGWQLSAVGVSATTLRDGDAEGLRYVPASGTPSAPSSPRGVCPAAVATTRPGTPAAATAAATATPAPSESVAGATATPAVTATETPAPTEVAPAETAPPTEAPASSPPKPGPSGPDPGSLALAGVGGGLIGLAVLRLIAAGRRRT
jgi:hypothetical protein